MIRTLTVLAALFMAGLPSAGAAQVTGAGTAQLAAAIQPDLDTLGFQEVDARSLSLRQLGAIRSAFSSIGAGMKAIDLQFRVQAILETDGYSTLDGTRVEGTRVGDF
ncbi:MAG: hypothetical protein AAF390_09230 [Pseudomonadota bacterium]